MSSNNQSEIDKINPETVKPETVKQQNWFALQYELFFIAVGFFTRLPVPKNLDFSAEKLNKACRYFSLVGWLVALVSITVFYVSYNWFDAPIATLLTMVVGVLLTGAFHEDGLMDSADGIGGGWTPEQKLKIMKDSRVGSYGSIAAWFVLSLKFALLLQYAELLGDGAVMLAILVAYPMSRAVATVLMFVSPYVRVSDDSKVKAVAEPKQFSDLYICLAFAFVSLVFVPTSSVLLLVALVCFVALFRYFAHKQVGGITGDLLGLAQQLSELLIYAVLIVSVQL